MCSWHEGRNRITVSMSNSRLQHPRQGERARLFAQIARGTAGTSPGRAELALARRRRGRDTGTRRRRSVRRAWGRRFPGWTRTRTGSPGTFPAAEDERRESPLCVCCDRGSSSPRSMQHTNFSRGVYTRFRAATEPLDRIVDLFGVFSLTLSRTGCSLKFDGCVFVIA